MTTRIAGRFMIAGHSGSYSMRDSQSGYEFRFGTEDLDDLIYAASQTREDARARAVAERERREAERHREVMKLAADPPDGRPG